jgi:inner membrane protein
VDPVTHILLGASLGYAAFGRKLGRASALAGGLAAFAPDADIFIRSAADPLLAVEYHRGFTHSVFFAPIGAAVVASLWLARTAWRDHGRWRLLWSCSLLAYLSHSFLDAATSYGTRLLWPFSDQRFGWDVISIIDPLVTLPLATGLLWSVVRRRPSAAWAALSVCVAYFILGGVQHMRAMLAQRQLAAARGHVIERFEVMPTLANNAVWRALYIHQEKIYADRIRVGWFSAPQVREGWSQPLVTERDLSATERARNQRRSFERFAWFSERWIARSPTDPSVLGDMRYSLSTEAFDPIWGIRFTAQGAPTEVEWVNQSRQRKISPRELWDEIVGADPRFQEL